jgi:hypothetical protein
VGRFWMRRVGCEGGVRMILGRSQLLERL